MKFIRSKPEKKKKVVAKRSYKKLHIICIALVFFIKIFITIHKSASGAELVGLEIKEMEINSQNQELKKLLVDRTSLTGLRETAKSDDFLQPLEIVYLKIEDTFAIAH